MLVLLSIGSIVGQILRTMTILILHDILLARKTGAQPGCGQALVRLRGLACRCLCSSSHNELLNPGHRTSSPAPLHTEVYTVIASGRLHTETWGQRSCLVGVALQHAIRASNARSAAMLLFRSAGIANEVGVIASMVSFSGFERSMRNRKMIVQLRAPAHPRRARL